MSLVNDLKTTINDLKEDEEFARRSGQPELASGLCLARVKLETLLDRNGQHRLSTLDADLGADTLPPLLPTVETLH